MCVCTYEFYYSSRALEFFCRIFFFKNQVHWTSWCFFFPPFLIEVAFKHVFLLNIERETLIIILLSLFLVILTCWYLQLTFYRTFIWRAHTHTHVISTHHYSREWPIMLYCYNVSRVQTSTHTWHYMTGQNYSATMPVAIFFPYAYTAALFIPPPSTIRSTVYSFSMITHVAHAHTRSELTKSHVSATAGNRWAVILQSQPHTATIRKLYTHFKCEEILGCVWQLPM